LRLPPRDLAVERPTYQGGGGKGEIKRGCAVPRVPRKVPRGERKFKKATLSRGGITEKGKRPREGDFLLRDTEGAPAQTTRGEGKNEIKKGPRYPERC